MVLVSVQSVEDDNGYSFKNDFAESLIIDPNSKISLINIQFQRKVDYVVLNGGNAFEIKVGDPTANKDIIGIPSGTYDKFSLSIIIQNRLNEYYLDTGHVFSVLVDKEGKFEISNEYRPAVLKETAVHKWDTTNLARIGHVRYIHSEYGNLFLGVDGNWHDEAYTGIPVGSSVYTQAYGHLLTDFVPDLSRGGSHITFRNFFSPATAQYPIDPLTAGLTNGIIFGLTKSGITQTGGDHPSFGVKQISTPASYKSFASGIMLKRKNDATYGLLAPTLSIIENGDDIGMELAFTAKPNDEYRILFAGDVNYPIYQYKRANDISFNTINMAGASQNFNRTLWYNAELSPLIGADNHLGSNPHINISMTADNSVNVLPIKIAGVSANNTHTFHEDDTTQHIGTLKRSVAGAKTGYNSQDGMLFNLCEADSFSEFTFKINSTAGDFSVAILDENSRLSTENAGTANGIPVGGALYGNTAQVNPSGGVLTYTASDIADKNPAVFVYRFNNWDGADGENYDSYSDYGNTRVWKRDNFNAYNNATTIGGRIVPLYQAIDNASYLDMDIDLNPTFKVRVNGSANMVELFYAKDADKPVWVLVDTSEILQKRKNGVKHQLTTVSESPITEGAFPVNSEVLLVQSMTSKIVLRANTDGAGNIVVPLLEVMTSGDAGFAEATTTTFYRLNTAANTIIDTQIVKLRFTKVDYDFTTTMGAETGIAMGTHFDTSKVAQGYRFFAGFATQKVSDGDPNNVAKGGEVNGVMLKTTSAIVADDYFEFYPRYEPTFGDMIGFKRTEYKVQKGKSAVSDTDPSPNQVVAVNPTLIINVDNLPHKSYIGKAHKADATLDSKPVGSQQGLTKMIGKVPRHHDDNGDGGSGGEGPFYFDYFPYSIPLRNATELTINELDITIRNPDGTLATDVIQTHMLLNNYK